MELRLGPSDISCTLSCIRESKHRSIMHVRPRLTITNSEPMLPADKKEVRINPSTPDLYFYLISSSSSTRKHFANQRQSIQQLPNFYSTVTSSYTGTGTIGHTYSTVHWLTTGYTGTGTIGHSHSTVHWLTTASGVAAKRSNPLRPRRQTLSL